MFGFKNMESRNSRSEGVILLTIGFFEPGVYSCHELTLPVPPAAAAAAVFSWIFKERVNVSLQCVCVGMCRGWVGANIGMDSLH